MRDVELESPPRKGEKRKAQDQGEDQEEVSIEALASGSSTHQTTDQKRKEVLARNAAREKARYDQMPEEKRREDQARKAAQKRARLEQMPEEKRKEDQARKAAREKARYDQMPEEKRKEVLARKAAQKRARREQMPEEEHKKFLEKESARKKARREQMPEEKRKELLAKEAARKRARKEQMPEEERKKSQAKHRASDKAYRERLKNNKVNALSDLQEAIDVFEANSDGAVNELVTAYNSRLQEVVNHVPQTPMTPGGNNAAEILFELVGQSESNPVLQDALNELLTQHESKNEDQVGDDQVGDEVEHAVDSANHAVSEMSRGLPSTEKQCR